MKSTLLVNIWSKIFTLLKFPIKNSKKMNIPIYSKQGKEPSFMIIGAQKAGTTTLYDILNSQDTFNGSIIKELHFFSKDFFYNKGDDYYLKCFSNEEKINFEATPAYLASDIAAKRIYEFNKDMKFIILLRNPAQRCYSAWNMFRSFNKNNPQATFDKFTKYSNSKDKEATSSLLFAKKFPSFKESITKEIDLYNNDKSILPPYFVTKGLYASQINNYLEYFDINNFLFIEQRELKQPEIVLNKVEDFLGIEHQSYKDMATNSNVGAYEEKSSEDEETLKYLSEFYKQHNEELFDLLSTRYDWND